MKKSWVKISALLLAILTVVVVRYFFGKASTAVHLTSGDLQGVIKGDILSFKGIPYAAAPIGDLRWRAPQSAPRWGGVRRANDFVHDCMQKPVASDELGTTPAEDCLYLNVWRPAASRFGKKYPVLVWIHGGGYLHGGSSSPYYDGSSFARQGIVFVSFNYRLGKFGFFAHPALTAAKEGPLANYGLLDQIAALQWVHKNIEAFGGLASKITVMGESSGGESVLTMMTAKAQANLFDRAIVMSGGGREPLSRERSVKIGMITLPAAQKAGLGFARRRGISGANGKALAALRALPARKLVDGLDKTYLPGPVLDGTLLKRRNDEVFKDYKSARIPLVIGSTDADLGSVNASSKNELFAKFGLNAVRAQQLYDPTGKKALKELVAEVGTDFLMAEPARFVAQHNAALGNPTWIYRFSYVADSLREKTPAAAHGTDVAFAFATIRQKYGSKTTENDLKTAHAINTYFGEFAKSGDPNGEKNPDWDKFNNRPRQVMNFTLRNGAVMQTDPADKRLDLIEATLDKKKMILSLK